MKTPVLAVLLCTLGVAFAQDANPIDPKQILLELKDLQTKQESTATTLQKRNIDLILKASASKDSAIAFYEDAQMATQFQGANRENSQFRDWKKRQEDQLKNNDFKESVRLHLYYLALTLRKAAGAKPEELVPQVADYLRVLDVSEAALSVRDSMLKNSVSDGIFARWLALGPQLADAKDWEMNPGKADQIAAKYLLPQWRKQKNPALIAYWDARILRASTAAEAEKLDFQQNNFAQIRKPDLLWQRSQEFLVLGQPNRAIQEMFGLIKTYPNHPNVAQWIGSLQKLLQPSESPVAPGAAK